MNIDYTDKYTPEQVAARVNERFEFLTKDKIPVEHPHVVFMGGLPGAGKSSAIRGVKEVFTENGIDENVIVVDLDAMREFHPKHAKIAENARLPATKLAEPDYYSNQTGEFAWEVSEGLKAKLQEKGYSYNVIIDGTAQNSKPIVELAKALKDSGYTSALAVFVPTDKDTAWEGTIDRYIEQTEDMKNEIALYGKTRIVPREVGRPYFDLVATKLPASIDAIHKSGEFEQISFIDRQGETKYDSTRNLDVNPSEHFRNLIDCENSRDKGLSISYAVHHENGDVTKEKYIFKDKAEREAFDEFLQAANQGQRTPFSEVVNAFAAQQREIQAQGIAVETQNTYTASIKAQTEFGGVGERPGVTQKGIEKANEQHIKAPQAPTINRALPPVK